MKGTSKPETLANMQLLQKYRTR